ncbi:NYN domain-containing protein [Eikenella sp. S3360]|uniref:NYN domain-containing protein n=1 Tax=Eikenella glucosivorans TaxID=2766967 RepID=A0ABS0NC49_9NEIS|nr:NYN domain-containing protein [Eikenella glucosivorans]MBH5329840.1 NYN domain-containing protein [Eikenella glucosivorans]
MQKNDQQARLAVLIDADNAPADIIDRLLEEIAKYGIASVKRIYGDWSHGLSKWKAALLPHAIIPVQQFAYTKGKNATDMALVIDAMDLLYSGNFDGFCIVSSDSDFTRLASRLRESGLTVYGFGEKKTPTAFRKACDKFVYTEIFLPEKQRANKERSNGKTPAPAAEEANNTPDALPLLKRAVRENADDLGWANLGPIGSYINKTNPDFDSRLYGYGKLSDLIKSFDIFEHRTDNNQLQVRRKTESRPERLPESEQSDFLRSKNERSELRQNEPKPNDQPADTKPAKPSSRPAKTENNPPKAAKPSFTKLIPLVQQAIQHTADQDGWARLGDVVKQLPAAIDPIQYGCANGRDLIHSIYSDWVEIKKAGRGERIRINKQFIVKTEQA